MKDVFKFLGGLAIVILLILAVSTTFGLFGLSWNRFAAPFQEETRAQTYENSRTFNQGMAIDLDNLCRQWRTTKDENEKAALAETIRLRVARYEINKLPSQVAACVREVN